MMVSSTLKQYKDSYNTNLEQFLNQYEDNTVLFFLQKEKDIYQTYQNALTKISGQLKMFTREELNRNLVHLSVAADLKKINTTAYDAIITEQSKLSPPEGVLSLHFEKSNTININEIELENHIKSSVMILKFINNKLNTLDKDFGRYNVLNNISKTPEILFLLNEILNNEISLFNVLNYIEEKTNTKTYDLFIKEFNVCYQRIACDFMFNVTQDKIIKALEIFKDNLQYIYVDEKEYAIVNHFVREFDGKKTVYNVNGFSFESKPNSEKIIYLNNLMIDYFDGFLEFKIEGFENIIHLKYIYEHLNEISDPRNQTTVESKETDVLECNDLLLSTIHDYLEEFKTEINGNGYEILVNALFEYFSKGSFPILTSKINFKKINKKRVGWALKKLYQSEKTGILNIEYFRFAKDYINLFENEIIVENEFNNSKFYKAFTTNVS